MQDNEDYHKFKITNCLQISYEGIYKFNIQDEYNYDNFINDVDYKNGFDLSIYDILFSKNINDV